MNRQDVKAETAELIRISLWCSENLSHDRMKVGVAMQLYMGDFEGDPVAGSLSAAGKWIHVSAIEEARTARPPGSIAFDVFKALTAGLPKRDRRLLKILWPKFGAQRWNRGTLKTAVAALGNKLARGQNARNSKPDTLRDEALEMIRSTSTDGSVRYISAVSEGISDRDSHCHSDRPGTDQSLNESGQTQGSDRPPSSSSSSSSDSDPEKRRILKPQKASNRAETFADESSDRQPEAPSDEEVAIWLPIVRGRTKADERRIRVSPVDGDGEEWAVLVADLDGYPEAYPGLDVQQQLKKAYTWLRSNRPERKTPRGMTRFLNGWMDRNQNRSRGRDRDAGRDTAGKAPIGGARGTNPEWGEQDELLKGM